MCNEFIGIPYQAREIFWLSLPLVAIVAGAALLFFSILLLKEIIKYRLKKDWYITLSKTIKDYIWTSTPALFALIMVLGTAVLAFPFALFGFWGFIAGIPIVIVLTALIVQKRASRLTIVSEQFTDKICDCGHELRLLTKVKGLNKVIPLYYKCHLCKNELPLDLDIRSELPTDKICCHCENELTLITKLGKRKKFIPLNYVCFVCKRDIPLD